MTKIYVNILKLKRQIGPVAGTAFLCLLMVLQGQKSFGQRVYANAEQHGGTGLDLGILGTLLPGTVINPTRSVDNDKANFSILKITISLLGSSTAFQNLQYTDVDTPKPSPNSPIYFKISPTSGSVLALLGGFKVQRTQNSVGVGQAYSGSQLLDLLGLFSGGDSTYMFVPPDNNTLPFDGTMLTYGTGVVGLLGNANVYFSFFIASPKISGNLDTVCENAMPDSLTLTLANDGDQGITYYLFTDTTGLHYQPGYDLNNTAAVGYMGTFSNHQKTIYNPFVNLLAGALPTSDPSKDLSQDFYIIAEDLSESPKLFYSGWKKITLKRNIQLVGPATVTIQ